MCRPTAWLVKNSPLRLTDIIASQSASVTSTASWLAPRPALLTRMSIRPWSAAMRSTAWRVATTSVTSRVTGRTLPAAGADHATAADSGESTGERTPARTVAPQAARALARSRPMPRPAPVTSATCPVRSKSGRSTLRSRFDEADGILSAPLNDRLQENCAEDVAHDSEDQRRPRPRPVAEHVVDVVHHRGPTQRQSYRPGGGRGYVGDAHVAPGRGLGDDIAHEGPVDRQEGARGNGEHGRAKQGHHQNRSDGTQPQSHGADGARDVDDLLASDSIGQPARRNHRDRHAHANDAQQQELRLPGLSRIHAEDLGKVEGAHDGIESRASQNEEAGRDQPQEASFAQDFAVPGLAGDGQPRPSVSLFDAMALVDVDDDAQHGQELDQADA